MTVDQISSFSITPLKLFIYYRKHIPQQEVIPWHALMTICEGNPSVAVVICPHKGPLIQSIDVSFIVTLTKLLNKQLTWDSLTLMWRHCNDTNNDALGYT